MKRASLKSMGREIVWKIIFEHLTLMKTARGMRARRTTPTAEIINKAFNENDLRLLHLCGITDKELKWLVRIWRDV